MDLFSLFQSNNFITNFRNREIGYLSSTNRYNFDYNLFEKNRKKTLYQRDIKGHTGCVNAVEFSRNENFIASGGDDCSVRMWSTVSFCIYSDPNPVCSMNEKHHSNIFTLKMSNSNEKIYSAGNDCRLLIHDIETKKKIRCYKSQGSYYRISVHPFNDHVISAGSDDGNVHIYDLREEDNCNSKISLDGAVYSVNYNPMNPYLISVCSRPKGLSIYDVRKINEHYATAGSFSKYAMCSSWNPAGNFIFCIRSKHSPLLFNLQNSEYIKLEDPEYSNLCTMKSCTFAGSEYMVTGSDDWNIYVWKIPKQWENTTKIENAYTILKGHRSIVNHISYSEQNNMLISSGVEKIIKCWNSYKIRCSYRNPARRQKFSRTILISGAPTLLAESTEEDLETLQQFDNSFLLRDLHSNYSFFSDDDSFDMTPVSVYDYYSTDDEIFSINNEVVDSDASSNDTIVLSDADELEVSAFAL